MGNLGNPQSITSCHFIKYGPSCKCCGYNIMVWAECQVKYSITSSQLRVWTREENSGLGFKSILVSSIQFVWRCLPKLQSLTGRLSFIDIKLGFLSLLRILWDNFKSGSIGRSTADSSLRSMVLASRAFGHNLDTQTLKNNPHPPPQDTQILSNFLKC